MTNDLIKRPEDSGDKPDLSQEHRGAQASKAERDSSQAGRRGEKTYAFIRQEDAREHVQRRWDWGDRPTWIILLLLCAIGLFIAITAYLLPQGRHMSPPTIHVY